MKQKYIITLISVVAFFLLFSIWSWIKPENEFSKSERRKLSQAPEISASVLTSGNFMTKFEDYTLDQFPLRDSFRNIKAMSENFVFHKNDNNDLYTHNGYISQMQYPMNTESIKYATDRFRYVYDKYLMNSNVYTTVIPDKNHFMASQSGHLSFDYEEFVHTYLQDMSFAKYIDIVPYLSLYDYYKTDTHWRQENITDVADVLLKEMESQCETVYTVNELTDSFYGVYYGQLALPVQPEAIKYLTNDAFKDCIIYDYEHAVEIEMYDLTKADSNDPYEVFLSGPLSLITITNPNAATNKELVLFRDSFGSSIAPLFAHAYSKITLIDIRYITPNVLSRYVNFDGADVLFLYSTLVLNNSEVIK